MPEGDVREAGAADTGEEAVREQDKFLPIANISRIMKRALPTNAKIAKDAKEDVQEFVSEFISFVTSEASDKCQREKRKTINGDDLLWAMTTLGFEDSIDVLRIYLSRAPVQAEGEKSVKGAADTAQAAQAQAQAAQQAQQAQQQAQQAQQQQQQPSSLPGLMPNQSSTMPGLPAGYTMGQGPPMYYNAQQQQQQQHQQQMMGMRVPNPAQYQYQPDNGGNGGPAPNS